LQTLMKARTREEVVSGIDMWYAESVNEQA
jgi:hypothetical protein